MFNIDATFEDLRLIATSANGQYYQVILIDNLTGQPHCIDLTATQLQMVLAVNLSNDGEPQGFEEFYKVLEPLLVDCPKDCRPIP